MVITAGHRVAGSHRVPGDKSITHRALMFAALAPGASAIEGALTADDARSTAAVLRRLGTSISPLRPGATVTVRGRLRLKRYAGSLDCGNSGTTVRLMLGILAAHRFPSRLTGDLSLRRRPMRRVTDPLEAMGARADLGSVAGLPITIRGGSLQPLEWTLPVASAQIKSALLLAGAVGGVSVTLSEPGRSRDHTERLLVAFGFTVQRHQGRLMMLPTGAISPFDLRIPGDPSSAAFLVAATLLAEAGDVKIEGVGLNPSRTGFLEVLSRMGASVASTNVAATAGEPVGDLVVRPAQLTGTTVLRDEVAGIIDEIPMLACLAARAHGVTRFEHVGELRVKESDRLALLVRNLVAIGANAAVEGDDLIIEGTDARFAGRVVTGGDHRIAMAFGVLGTQRGQRITMDDPECASVSFPGFSAALAALFGRAR